MRVKQVIWLACLVLRFCQTIKSVSLVFRTRYFYKHQIDWANRIVLPHLVVLWSHIEFLINPYK